MDDCSCQGGGSLTPPRIREKKEITTKSSAVDLVTQCDGLAEALIRERIGAKFPTHQVVGEEEGGEMGSSHPYTWHVDPLDGTLNFAHGIPHFAVSIGLFAQDTPLLGVVYDPMRDECFSAAVGHGAHLNTGGETPQPIRCSTADSLLHSLLATGFSYDRHTSDKNNVAQVEAFLKQAQGIRRMGSAALDMAYVAAGRIDGYWELVLYIWDVAAGVVLVREAGGRISHLEDGSAFRPALEMALVTSNRPIHQPMLNLLHQL